MIMQEKIEKRIRESLQPEALEIINDSHKHRGHAGDDGSGQTHFRIKIVSKKFEGLTRIDRTRQVNMLLEPLFDQGLHAISYALKTTEEVSD